MSAVRISCLSRDCMPSSMRISGFRWVSRRRSACRRPKWAPLRRHDWRRVDSIKRLQRLEGAAAECYSDDEPVPLASLPQTSRRKCMSAIIVNGGGVLAQAQFGARISPLSWSGEGRGRLRCSSGSGCTSQMAVAIRGLLCRGVL